MEKQMTPYLRAVALIFSMAAVGGQTLAAQSAGEKMLLTKAHSLEASGHIDLAAQTWQQVLLSDPNNAEAIAGLARWAKRSGKDTEAQKYLDRLRQLNPGDPEINRVASTISTKAQNQKIQQAGKLAEAGQPEQALKLYREVWGTHPPDGDEALGYYDTEAATETGRADAIAGLRTLMKKYPADSRYAVTLGRILTYKPATRGEGERILRQYPQDGNAQAALRQALGWDAQNPNAAPLIRDYLKQHQDTQLAEELKQTEAREAKARTGLAITPAEQQAYTALAANRLEDAENRFVALSNANPKNGRAYAGLGFVRMKQGNFAGAISFFSQAEQDGVHVASVTQALATSRFWYTVQQGTAALNSNQMPEAVAQYRAALDLRPGSPDALEGLAGAYMKGQQYSEAASVYERLTRTPGAAQTAWRGMFMAQAQAGNAQAALAVTRRIPAAVRAGLLQDPEYLRALASVYSAAGQDAEAQQVLAQALKLPFPENGRAMKADTRMQYAGLLQQSKHYAQAAGLYREIVNDNPANVGAWQGLVSVEHQAGEDANAISIVEQMPPATYDAALRDPGFLAMVASIYQSGNHLDVAQSFLERAAKLAADNNQQPSPQLQLQLASIYLARNNPQQAYAIYRSVLTSHPDHVDGWKGLLAALHSTGHDEEALAQVQQIPAAIRHELEQDVEYQQTIAGVYAATGSSDAALRILSAIQAHYAREHTAPPVDVDIQNAWLLYNAGADRDLYNALMRLGGRTDMTDAQRRTVQTIWASWSVRRAGQAADAGNSRRSLEILNAASRAFPGNPQVAKALASSYLKAGEAKQALTIYQSLAISNAGSGDYQGMVGAALAAQNKTQAETWLRQALAQYPNDPQILSLAAKFEQARGDNARAAAYWRASLNAMPKVTPENRLAHTLDTPEPVTQTRMTSAQATDLAGLLNPDADGAEQARQSTPPPLPSYNAPAYAAPVPAVYGPDPYTGSYTVSAAPVTAAPSSGSAAARPSTAAAAQKTRHVETAPAASKRLGDYRPQASLTSPDALPQAGAQEERAALAAAAAPVGAFSQSELYAPALPSGQQAAASATTGVAGFAPGAGEGYAAPADLHLSLSASAPRPPVLRTETQQAEAAISDLAVLPATQITLDAGPAIAELANAHARLDRAQRALAAAAQTTVEPPAYQPAQYTMPQPPAPAQQAYYTGQAATPGAATNRQYPPYQRPGGYQDPLPAQSAQTTQGGGATDDQLMQQNLPPLRGPYTRSNSMVRGHDARQEAEMELASIEGGYSPWTGGTGQINHRSGAKGFDQMTAFEAPFEGSAMLGSAARVTIIGRPAFLDSGLADGTSTNRLGTLPVGAAPAQQNAAGIGGEVQITGINFGVAAGYTPYGFLVSNAIGRFRWRPAAGPVNFTFTRDSIKDTQLSYSGLRDPGSAGPTYTGNVWGGVVANAGQVQYARGDAKSGYYLSGGGQYITGHHVQTNSRIDGDAGAYWRVLAVPDLGTLTIGGNFFGMHYGRNLRYFTYGHGGYFSPQAYFLASAPVTWEGRYGVNFHYRIAAALGAQAFQEDASSYFPLDNALQVASNNPSYPSTSNVGSNYDFRSEAAYSVNESWYIGGYLAFNNTRNYASQTVGFFIRLMGRPQAPTELGPTGLFPADGLRPVKVP